MKQCRTPITSNGVIHVHDGMYLMIKRRKTLGYVDFMRGRYNKNTAYMMNLVDEMTVQEKNDLLQHDFTHLSHDMWHAFHEEASAREKFNEIKRDGTLKKLIDASTTQWDTQEWGFPKGRRNSNESEISCALREYEEETGHDKHSLILLRNVLPFEEIFIGSNFKAYKHKYYIVFGEPKVLRTFQESEVSALQWFTYEEALEKIRPYNVERKKLLTCVHRMITDYFTYTEKEKEKDKDKENSPACIKE
jgi:8-oxo-dGTP pyrophosphatase MutT (NUDIX family)